MKVLLNTLYVQTQGSYLRLDHETLKIEVERELTFQIPLHHLGAIVTFGNVLISPFLIHRCAEDGRALIWLSEYGRFRARANGSTSGNVLLRQAQYSALESTDAVLLIARYIVAGKLQNARLILMRSARDAKNESDRTALSAAAATHAEAIKSAEKAESVEKLRGIEGYAAKAYFAAFSHMIRLNRDAFALTERSRRPPRDPINAMLSFVYTLLVNDCVSACEGVGLDPQVGFLHAIRPGRPSLALDLMEELRAPIADRLVLTLINRGQIKPEHFLERPGGAIFMTDDARKTVLAEFQKRKKVEVNHPILATKVPLGLVNHTQARLLARHLRGDVPTYQPFILR
ncbi:CRISPR-associated protein, Cas1 family [Thalassoporum mexicanum PCC 7367]|uniref:type I-C CRISPR-associated endonuclease Cas1c n=1 Tax=Thalassoporum mexicanum TaxID=3457544 RepID=UPI00029F8A94|nr:type I-C CRISPR-associated endonuclease Cas1c [Pseudanabaena sp. PCC 7367]AFY70027.1 CRISPR-associated protein, Cas1 family [Pseudanabaena sp. PCC 7367]